jgi:hypothetical protein
MQEQSATRSGTMMIAMEAVPDPCAVKAAAAHAQAVVERACSQAAPARGPALVHTRQRRKKGSRGRQLQDTLGAPVGVVMVHEGRILQGSGRC